MRSLRKWGVKCPGSALNVRWSQKHQVLSLEPGLDAEASPIDHQQQPRPCLVGRDTPVLALDTTQILPPEWNWIVSQNSDSPVASNKLELLLWDNSFTPAVDEDLAVLPLSPASFKFAENQSNANCISRGLESLPRSSSRTSTTFRAIQLSHVPTALTEHFFRDIISLYCSWDSKLNPMRSILENMWQSSSVLHHTMQSMAACCLSEYFPQLMPVAKSEHLKA